MPTPGKLKTTYQPRLIPGDVNSLVISASNALGTSIQQMTLLERRVIMLVLAVLQRTDTELPFVRIYASDIRRTFKLTRNSINEELNEISSQLMTRYAEFFLSKHGSNSRISWVNEINFTAGADSETGQAYLDLQLHERMTTHVLQLKGSFFNVPLWAQARCTTIYSVQFMDLLMSESHSGKKGSFSIDLPDLFAILNCNLPSYTRNFANFRLRILEPVQKELEEIGYVTFEYEPIKRGRKIIALRLSVTVGHKTEADVLDTSYSSDDVRRLTLENLVRGSGFTGNLHRYVNQLGLDLVERLYHEARTEERQANNTPNEIRNFGAFFRSKLDTALAHPPSAIVTIYEDGRVALNSQEIQGKVDELLHEFTEARTDFAYSTYSALDPDSRERVAEAAVNQDPHWKQRIALAGGQDSNIFRHAVRRVLEDEGLTYPPTLSSIKAFLADGQLEPYRKEDAAAILRIASDAE